MVPKRRLSENVVESEIKELKFWHLSNNQSENRTLKRILLVATYHPLLNASGKVLSKNLNISYMDEEVKEVFHFEVPERLVATL